MKKDNDIEFHGRRMLYLQVRDYILDRINEGVFKAGELIPPERELAENLQISRYTVRRALQELVKEDVLHRVQGSGTYVRERKKAETKRLNSIGIVMPFSDAAIEMMLLSGMQNALRETAYNITLHTTANCPAQEWEGIQRLRNEGVAGLVIMPATAGESGRIVLDLKQSGFPFVLVDRRIDECITDCVASDNVQGGRLAAKHLLDLGHRKIAFLHHRKDHSSSVKDRCLGYETALRDHGGHNSNIFAYEFGAGLADLKQFLQKEEYTGLIAVNEVVAGDILRVCRELGIKAPRDYSLVSFDDLSTMNRLDISLTTVTQHSELIGAKAVEILIDRIENHGGSTPNFRQIYYPTRLNVRDSCRKID